MFGDAALVFFRFFGFLSASGWGDGCAGSRNVTGSLMGGSDPKKGSSEELNMSPEAISIMSFQIVVNSACDRLRTNVDDGASQLSIGSGNT